MLQKIIELSLHHKLVVGLLVCVLIGFGIYETTQLPIDAVPDITNNQVQVITVAPSYSATDIERLVTFPIEQACSNIQGVEEQRSFSRFGLSLITIVFKDEVDIYWARQQVFERLQAVQSDIPAEIGKPQLAPITTGLGEIYQYVLRVEKGYEQQYDTKSLRTLQDWVVRRQLLGIEGIADVSSFGGHLKQYEVIIKTEQLAALGISIPEVIEALEKNNQNTGGAYLEKNERVYFIRSEGLFQNIANIEQIVIKPSKNGVPILLKNVADVRIGSAIRYGALAYNDEGETVGGIVMMLKGANSSKVIKKVKERIAQIQQNLPKGVIIEPFLDRTKMVDNAISTVVTNLAEGALIVVAILILFLGNLRSGLIVASVIPLSMLFAVICMNQFKVSGNLMSLGSLDFGLIIDGAVIIVEAVMHQLASKVRPEPLSSPQMDNLVKTTSNRMLSSAVFGQVIILTVYLPIFSLGGIEGKMFIPMAQTVAFALVGAFLLSLTYVPVMIALFLNTKSATNLSWSDRFMLRLEHLYGKTLKIAIRKSYAVLGFVLCLFFVAIFFFMRLGGEFIPTLEEGDFAVESRVMTGSSLQTTLEYTQKAAGILKKKFPEVQKVVTKVGSGEIPTDPMPMEAADMMVILKNKKEWTSARTFPELAQKMENELAVLPGLSVSFQYPVQMRFNELMTGAKQDVVCKIFGEDLEILSFLAAKVAQNMSQINGAEDIYVETITGVPEILIQYNRAKISQYGLSIAQLNQVINTTLAGQVVGKLYEGEKRFDVVVRLDKSAKTNLADIENLYITSPQGHTVALKEVATILLQEGPNQIQRENAKRRIVVGFNVRNRDVESTVKELQAKINQQIVFPTGYNITYGGTFENLNHAKKRLSVAVPITLLLIFVMLYFTFGSIKQSLLVYATIPLSTIGGVYFLVLRDMPFSISAGIGFIALFGIAVLNGIVLIAEFNRLRTQFDFQHYKIILQGTTSRLRPVLMTASVASLGFLPMAMSQGAGAEVQKPLATVVIGGLVIASFLTLFVLPILYFLLMKKNKSSVKK